MSTNRWKYVFGILSLVRLNNLLGIALLAKASVVWSGLQHWSEWEGISFTLGFVLIAAGGYAWNDLCDWRIDLINRPSRPLPSRQVTEQRAYLVVITTGLLGGLLLCSFGWGLTVAAAATVSVLCFYSLKLKSAAGFIGNLVVAACVAEIPLFAGMLTGNTGRMVPLAATMFGLMLIREVLKDLEDAVGDRSYGRRTIAALPKPVISLIVFGALMIAVLGGLMTSKMIAQPLLQAAAFVAVCITFLLVWAWGRNSNLSWTRFTQRAMWVAAFIFALVTLIAGLTGGVEGH